MIRRCRTIVVCDASCDEECSLADLGAAIRRIRIDFGIPIEFASDFRIRKRSADGSTADDYDGRHIVVTLEDDRVKAGYTLADMLEEPSRQRFLGSFG